ncbi:hypothetical protein [Pseudomonas sp. IAC-BECa141]|uniref:hypothetical protein n=1 Tax=Pseudomonas sp. IAC-BECa141 TaxID=2793103 RepID=UPI001D0867C6|nr:hypothetical protein [Pseudomonas sp. IAC-BECa141]
MTPVFAAWKEHPENSWKYYLANCQRMQEKMADVQSGRVSGAFEVMGNLENSLGSMNEHRTNLPPQYLASREFAQCENVAVEADAMIARGKAEFADRMNQAAEQGRIAHQNSPNTNAPVRSASAMSAKFPSSNSTKTRTVKHA